MRDLLASILSKGVPIELTRVTDDSLYRSRWLALPIVMLHRDRAIKQEMSQQMADSRHLGCGKEELTVPAAFNCSKEFDMVAMADFGYL
jgi:hypothetical protein